MLESLGLNPNQKIGQYLVNHGIIQIGTSVLVASLIIVFLASMIGVDPFTLLRELWLGAVGTPEDVAISVNRASPLMIAGVGVAIALRTGAFNMGVEGQIALGGLTASWLGLYLGELPAVIAIPVILIGAAVIGALWACLAGIVSLWRGINIVIVTLLMNFIALYLVSAIVTGPLNQGQGVPATPVLPESVHLPMVIKGMHAGILLGLLVTVLG